jgi:nucleotide-binding universal stress UspA family protein
MIKDLMLYLDGTADDEVRLAHAESIAARSGAHLTGLFVNPLPEYAVALTAEPGYAAATMAVRLEEQARSNGEVVLARLKVRFGRIGVLNEVRDITETRSAISRIATSTARGAELFVASAPYRVDSSFLADHVFITILFGAGHGVYVVPPDNRVREDVRNVVIAWKDTRESARAISEAMPFLTSAANARIVTVDAERCPGDAAIDIAAHLDRQGVKVEITPIESAERTVAEILLDEAHKMSADLIVMGAYGHSRVREWILGGATREMLETSDVPMLMAH